MTQQAQQTTDISPGTDGQAAWAHGVFSDVSVAYQDLWGPFTTPTDKMTVLRLYQNLNTNVSYGSPPFQSHGYFLGMGPLGEILSSNSNGGVQSFTGDFANSLTETLIYNRIFLLPDHGPLTLTKVEGIVNITLAISNGSYFVTCSRMDVEIHTISSLGVESVALASQSQTGLGLTGTNGTNNETAYQTFSITSTLNIAAGTRLAVRIKLYGFGSNSANCYLNLNGLRSVPLSSPDMSPNPTIMAFHFK